jgi:hypothetical protein
MNIPDNQEIYVPSPPVHWTSSVVHGDKPSNKPPTKYPNKPNNCTQIKTCKLINTFFLQYY